MAMDDQQELVRGLMIDGVIAIPDRWEDGKAIGKWLTWKVLQVMLNTTYDRNGFPTYQGYVILQDTIGMVESHEFNKLWLSGWTSKSLMDEIKNDQKVKRNKPRIKPKA